MRRVFDLDVLACPRCGGRMSVIATIEAADVLRKILGHLGLPSEPPAPLPSRSPPSLGDLFRGRAGAGGERPITIGSVNFPGLSCLRPGSWGPIPRPR